LPRFSENLKPYKPKFFAYKQNTAFHSPTTLCSKPNFEQHATGETAKTLFQKRPRVTTTTINTLLNATMSQSPIAGRFLLFFCYSFFVEENDVLLSRRKERKDSKKKKKKRR
jgi:hypothetical protein